MKSRILFAPIHGPSLLEMLPIAKKLIADGRYEPVFFIYRDIPGKNQKLLMENGLRVIGPKAILNLEKDSLVPNTSTANLKRSEGESLGFGKRLLRKALNWTWFSFLYYVVKFSRIRSHARRLLTSEKVAAVLLIGDRHVGWETALVKAANDRDLPTLIVPFAVSDPGSDVEARLRRQDLDRYRVSTSLGRAVAHRFSNWARESAEGLLFFTPLGEALAAKVLNMMPDLPWTIGGGAARRIAVESPHALNAYLQEGIPPQKLVVTGKPSVDQIYDQMQGFEVTKMRDELGIREDQPVILCSVPQLAEHKLLSWEEHWYEMEFLFRTLTQEPDTLVLLSLHPQSDPIAYQALADKFSAVIARQRIYDLIPICDLLVATYSSVVVTAIGCGKPTLVVDFYGLDFNYYDNAPGVIVLRDRDALAATLSRLLRDRDYAQKLSDLQLQQASEWVLLDGQCTQRLVDKLYQMIEE